MGCLISDIFIRIPLYHNELVEKEEMLKSKWVMNKVYYQWIKLCTQPNAELRPSLTELLKEALHIQQELSLLEIDGKLGSKHESPSINEKLEKESDIVTDANDYDLPDQRHVIELKKIFKQFGLENKLNHFIKDGYDDFLVLSEMTQMELKGFLSGNELEIFEKMRRVLEKLVQPAETSNLKVWLSSIGLEKFEKKFLNEGFDHVFVCTKIDEIIMEELGITLPGHMKKLKLRILEIEKTSKFSSFLK